VDIVKAIENHFGVRCLNKEAIENLYSLLYPYAQVSDVIKKHHIESIKDSLAGQERQKADCHINERETMEQWEKEYIDAVTKSRRAKEQGKTIDCAYEEGYDSSRWVEMILPDGKNITYPKKLWETGAVKENTAVLIRNTTIPAGMKWKDRLSLLWDSLISRNRLDIILKK